MLLKVKCLAPGRVAHGTTRICSLTPEPASFWEKEKFIYLFYIWLRWVSVAAWAFSLVGVERGLLCGCGAWLRIVGAPPAADHGPEGTGLH